MAHLPQSVRKQFRSDMRIIVDYLAEGTHYHPTSQKIIHVDAFLRMMKLLTGDIRYEDISKNVTAGKKEEKISMCELLDRYWNDGVEKGRTEGEFIGVVKGKAESVGNIRSMDNHKLSAEVISELVNQKLEYINRIISLCHQYPAEDNISIAKRLLGET